MATACTGACGLKIPEGGVGMFFGSGFLPKKKWRRRRRRLRMVSGTRSTTWRGCGGSRRGAEEEMGAEMRRSGHDQPRGRAPAPAHILLISLTATLSPIRVTRRFDSVPICLLLGSATVLACLAAASQRFALPRHRRHRRRRFRTCPRAQRFCDGCRPRFAKLVPILLCRPRLKTYL